MAGKAKKSTVDKAPRTRTVHIPGDDQAAEALELARGDLEDTRIRLERGFRHEVTALRVAEGLPAADAEKAVTARHAQELAPFELAVGESVGKVRASMLAFTMRALGRRAYRALVEAHQGEDTAKDPAADGDEGFARALVQASCVDPVLSAAEVAHIFDGDEWNNGEISYLFAAAYEVNTKRRVVDL